MLLAVQAALLIGLAVARWSPLARQAGPRPPGGGWSRPSPAVPAAAGLAALVALLGLVLGGLLTAVINLGVTRILGTPVPSGFRFATAPSDALAVPWPIYAFGVAPIGLLRRRRGRRRPAVVRYRDAAQPASGQTADDRLPGGRRLRGPDGRRRQPQWRRPATEATAARSPRHGRSDLLTDEAAAVAPWPWAAAWSLASSPSSSRRSTPARRPSCAAGRLVARPGLAGRAGRDPGGRLAGDAAALRRTPTPPSARPSAPCGTWPRSGRGPCTRWPRPATPSGRYPRSSTGSGC